MFMPITLAGHVTRHRNHVVNSLDENNNIGSVYWEPDELTTLLLSALNHFKIICKLGVKHYAIKRTHIVFMTFIKDLIVGYLLNNP